MSCIRVDLCTKVLFSIVSILRGPETDGVLDKQSHRLLKYWHGNQLGDYGGLAALLPLLD